MKLTAEPETIATRTYVHQALAEAATFSVPYKAGVADHQVTLSQDSSFRAFRWVQKLTDLNDITINDESMRQLVVEYLTIKESA